MQVQDSIEVRFVGALVSCSTFTFRQLAHTGHIGGEASGLSAGTLWSGGLGVLTGILFEHVKSMPVESKSNCNATRHKLQVHAYTFVPRVSNMQQ